MSRSCANNCFMVCWSAPQDPPPLHLFSWSHEFCSRSCLLFRCQNLICFWSDRGLAQPSALGFWIWPLDDGLYTCVCTHGASRGLQILEIHFMIRQLGCSLPWRHHFGALFTPSASGYSRLLFYPSPSENLEKIIPLPVVPPHSVQKCLSVLNCSILFNTISWCRRCY